MKSNVWPDVPGPLVVAPNHVSFLDGALIALNCPRPLLFGVAPEYCGFPYSLAHRALSWRTGGSWVPISESDPYSFRVLIRHLRGGGAVCLFPEGGIGDGTGLLRLKSGVARLAVATGATVLPVRIDGPERSVFGRHPERGLWNGVRVRPCAPWRPEGMTEGEMLLRLSWDLSGVRCGSQSGVSSAGLA